ncbi:MAG: hypothetical protein BWY74_02735 [Firmicutes bacterium ADurb.Bin419]|nr:MAG: hypothetical protein BWY74_02735 [Firmicutes bacterium ADurb.Bin419]
MKSERYITCIVCPNGCKLEVICKDTIIVKNALCPKGEEYAKNEVMNPVRTVTSTVKVCDGVLPLVSVRSSKPVPKEKIPDIIQLLKEVDLEAPVEFHKIIYSDILGTGADIIATREVKSSK